MTGGIGNQVFHLLWIGGEVEILPERAAFPLRITNQLGGGRADAEDFAVGRCHPIRGRRAAITVIMVVERIPPFCWFAENQRFHRAALDVVRHLDVGKIKDRWGDINHADDSIAGGAGVSAGHADNQRDEGTLFVHPHLVVEAMLAEEVSVVGGVDDDGVCRETGFFKVVHQPADIFINAGDHPQVIAHISLVNQPGIVRSVAGKLFFE